jgi:DNA-binding MarR family transcriptional regulator
MSDQDISLIINLQRLTFRIERNFDQILFEKFGIGFSQYKILEALDKNPKYTQKQLSSLLGQTEASVSRQIKILRSDGLISTTINPKNRREHITIISPKGGRIHDAAYSSLEIFSKKILESIDSKEKSRLSSLISKISMEA